MKIPGFDQLKKIFSGSNSPGTKSATKARTPAPPSPATVSVLQPPPGTIRPPTPAVPPVPRKKTPGILDRIARFFAPPKAKKTVPSKNKSPSAVKGPATANVASPTPGTISTPTQKSPPSPPQAPLPSGDIDDIRSLIRDTEESTHGPVSPKPPTGKSPAPAYKSVTSAPELVPAEVDAYSRQKPSTLDPLKRAFGIKSEPGKKEAARDASKKKTPAATLQYDPARDGPLVDAEIPQNYTEIDRYWVDNGESLVVIALNQKSQQPEYLLYEPVLTDFQYELIERVHADLRTILILDDTELKRDKKDLLIEKTDSLFHEYGIVPEPVTRFKLQYYLIRNFLGWGRIEALMKDPYIEDISCDGTMIPLFLYHRKFRNIKTNITFRAEVLDSLAITLAQRSGKHISTGSPIIDATLPDGSRLQLTLGREVTTRGTSFTIRKFREDPFSPVELLMNGTFNEDELVYFWMAIENNKSLLFIGGTASGKTTSLNATSLFIPPMAKVVSIEDTREITLFHENWIASVTRDSIAEGVSMISMFDLLRAAMRQRPEYIIVGEVRGAEAQTLFQAMNTGHTTFSTLHAGSVDAAIHRLESDPLNVPRNMLQALNVISVQALVYRGQERIRRVQEIVEIAGADPTTGSLRVNTVFTYDPISDTFQYNGRSQVYVDIAEKRGWSREQLEDEIRIRKIIIRAMKDQGIIDYIQVSQLFQAYYINPAKVIESIGDLKSILKGAA